MKQLPPFTTILSNILEVMQLPKEPSDKLIATYQQLCFERFVRVLMEVVAEDKKKEVAEAILLLVNDNTIGDEDVEQLTIATADAVPEAQQQALYLAAKTTILLELIDPLLKTASTDELTAINTILLEHKELTQLVQPFLDNNDAFDKKPS